MRLFLVCGEVHSSKRTVQPHAMTKGHEGEPLPNGIIKDTRETFMVHGGKLEEKLIPALSEAAAIRKVTRRFLMEEIHAYDLGRACHRRIWRETRDQNGNPNGGKFSYPPPSYADCINHPTLPAQSRMLSVHNRLTRNTDAENRVSAYRDGWEAAKAAYSPRCKTPAAKLKAASKADAPALPNDYAAGFLRSWAILANRKAPNATPAAFRKFKKKATAPAACIGQ